MELGSLFLEIVVFLWWHDNLYEFVSKKHPNNPKFGLSTAKGGIKKDGNSNIQYLIDLIHSMNTYLLFYDVL